ncbi:hypothetical protein ACVINW_001337 [Bradyrhizobium sp. USDA 4461]
MLAKGRLAGKGRYPAFQVAECLDESRFLLKVGALDGGGVPDSPMRRHGLPRPYRASLPRGVVANREDESITGASARANSSQLFDRKILYWTLLDSPCGAKP